jgi:hypothetical protein
MKAEKQKLPRIRDILLSPLVNPLLEPQEIRVQRRYVRTSSRQELMDARTGELTAVTAIHTIEERDDAEFVKVFAEGVKAAFSLSRTGYRVFQAVLAIYQNTSMKGGFAESVDLFWFGEGLNGQAVGLSEPTLNRGLRELLANRFLYPRSPSSYWVNPSLFFKGDRVAFVKEYRRKRREQELTEHVQIEAHG